jgi:hypothetical protein
MAACPTCRQKVPERQTGQRASTQTPQYKLGNRNQEQEITLNAERVLTLLLALSGALNVAFGAGIAARHGGAGPAQAILTAVGAAGTVMTIFFAAVSAYH